MASGQFSCRMVSVSQWMLVSNFVGFSAQIKRDGQINIFFELTLKMKFEIVFVMRFNILIKSLILMIP